MRNWSVDVAFILVVTAIGIMVVPGVIAKPVPISLDAGRVEDNRARQAGLSDIQSVKTNINDCLSKVDTALTGTTNALAEAQALSASATKTALVDTVKAQKDLAQAIKQLVQATRDLMQAVKKINKDYAP